MVKANVLCNHNRTLMLHNSYHKQSSPNISYIPTLHSIRSKNHSHIPSIWVIFSHIFIHYCTPSDRSISSTSPVATFTPRMTCTAAWIWTTFRNTFYYNTRIVLQWGIACIVSRRNNAPTPERTPQEPQYHWLITDDDGRVMVVEEEQQTERPDDSTDRQQLSKPRQRPPQRKMIAHRKTIQNFHSMKHTLRRRRRRHFTNNKHAERERESICAKRALRAEWLCNWNFNHPSPSSQIKT